MPRQFVATILLLFSLAFSPLSRADAAVAMPDRYSAEATATVIASGGNAVDATITAVFVLAVTQPEAGNIGGGGFMLSYMDGEAAFLDFREKAPAAAHRDMYLDEGGQFQPRQSLVGGKASGVPGTVRGMWEAHQRYGSRPWKELLQPAIGLARDGFELHAKLVAYAREAGEYFAGETNFDQYFGELKAKEMFRQPDLARTLELIAEDPDSFYTGPIATRIADQMQRTGGLITRDDLAAYRAVWREPLVGDWREFKLYAAPPPSSGGIALLQLLGMRDAADKHFQNLWHNSPQYVHLMAELSKRVFADRAEYLGDPDYAPVPTARLLDPEYLKSRAAQIDPTAISPAAEVPPGLESPQTTHFSILDQHGNAVSVTYTLNNDFGSGVVVEGAGFLLNNEMDDFSAKPGAPNFYGVVGGDRNAIEPGKRMLSSMTPTLLLENGKPALVVGSPGGSTIITTVFQVILNIYDFDMTAQEAVDASRFHHQLPAERLIRTDTWPQQVDTVRGLEQMGYTVEANSWGDLGDAQVVLVRDGQVSAASDRRGRGKSLVVPEKTLE